MGEHLTTNEIEFAKEEDIPKWMELVELVKDSFPGLEGESYLAILRKNIRRQTALCYKEQGNIIGILLFSPNQNTLSCMAVHPECRRRKIASRLIDKMLMLLPRGSDITVTTFREDDLKGIAPRALYKKYGFQEAELCIEFGYPVQRFILPGRKNCNHAKEAK